MAKATKASVPVKKIRARKKDGSFQADDPSTPDVNEAFVQASSVSVSGVATTASPVKETRGRKKKAETPKRTRVLNEFGDIVKV